MQLTAPSILVFLNVFLLYVGVMKIYFPEKATISDLLKLNEMKQGQKISFSQIVNRDIEGVNNSYVSNFKAYDSVLTASSRMQEDFFNVIQVLLLPTIIILAIFVYSPAHPIFLAILAFVEALIAVNRYSTFDSFTKNIEDHGYESAVDILKSNTYMSANLSINTNFLIFPSIQLFLIYCAMFVKF